eukprot:COSAG06_NODE_35607_length_458_cov_0.618384_2_plen_90_part_01
MKAIICWQLAEADGACGQSNAERPQRRTGSAGIFRTGRAVALSRSQLGGDDTPCTMLQLKLAMFAQLPYPGKMIPGVFVTCADDILIFDS